MSCNSRLIVIASVHSRMYKPLAHSTSADSHSVFIRLRVRFDTSQVAYVVHNARPLPPHTRRNGLDSACLRLQRQCGAARRSVEAVSEKKFSDLPPSTVQKRGGGAYRGEKLISENRVANCTLPCSTLSGVGYGRAQHRHLPNRRYSPTQCTSDATQAMLMAGVLGAERMRRSRRRSCSNRGCQRPMQ